MKGDYNSGLKELSGEELDDAVHQLDQLTQRWQDRLSIENLRFVERYAKAELCLCVEMLFKEVGLENYVAIFERKWRPRPVDDSVGDIPDCGVNGDFKGNIGNLHGGRNDSSMLINDVQPVQTPQGIALPSTVRLQRSDCFFNVGADTSKEIGSFPLGELALAPMYWEVGFLHYVFGRMPGGHNHACSQRVEGSHKIVNNVADVGSPQYGDGFSYSNAIEFCRGLSLFIGEDRVSITTLEGLNLSVEIVKVFFCPVNLYN